MTKSRRHLAAIKRISPNLILMAALIMGLVAANHDEGMKSMAVLFFGDGLYLLYVLMAVNLLIGAIVYWVALSVEADHKNG